VGLIGGLIGLHGASLLGALGLLWWRDLGVAAPRLSARNLRKEAP
jgi:hypothetical protein